MSLERAVNRYAEPLKSWRRPQGGNRKQIAKSSSTVGGVGVGDMSRSDVRERWETCLIGRKANREHKS